MLLVCVCVCVCVLVGWGGKKESSWFVYIPKKCTNVGSSPIVEEEENSEEDDSEEVE